MKLAFFKENLINPSTKQGFESITDDALIFKCHNKFEVLNKIPIIIDESNSIFKVQDILAKAPTTQNINYSNNSFKNIVRKQILPTLSKDFNQNKRYKILANLVDGKSILVIGAGEKINFYNKYFKNSLIITSDVHLQFSPDIIFDAHQIPFKDECFDLIIVSQVLEHTFKPWEVAKEMERVTKIGGYLLVEVPFNFPYHSPPYDFFRFTYTGLRSLFAKCSLYSYEASEGNASTVAVFNAQFLVDLFSNRYLRIGMLFLSRFLFGWIKYIDLLRKNSTYNSTFFPMGISMIFKKNNKPRSNIELLDEFYKLKTHSK